jgi:hypothetical protein
MYVALGTTSDAFSGATGAPCAGGGWASCLPVLEATDEYVEKADWARLCESALVERGAVSPVGESGSSLWTVVVVSFESRRLVVVVDSFESRRLLAGCGLAPLGRATRLLRRSDKYAAV